MRKVRESEIKKNLNLILYKDREAIGKRSDQWRKRESDRRKELISQRIRYETHIYIRMRCDETAALGPTSIYIRNQENAIDKEFLQ